MSTATCRIASCTRKNHAYTLFISKDAALDGSGDFRDRSLAVAISVALHAAAFGWMWFVGDQAGWGKSEVSGYSRRDGTSADFLAPDEFRQRIEVKPALASPDIPDTSERPLNSEENLPADHVIDTPEVAEFVPSAEHSTPDVAPVQNDEVVPTESIEADLAQGERMVEATATMDYALHGALVGAVARGTVSVGKAVRVQMLVNGAVGTSSVVAQGAIEGAPVSESQVVLGGASSVIGGLAASGIGAAMGDFGEAATKGGLQRIFGSSSPGSPNVALTTASTGNAIPVQSGTQALASEGAQGVAQGVVEAGKKTMEKPH